MLLPNHEQAIIPPEKLAGYALSPEHEDGRHKARVFRSALGLTAADAGRLEAAIREGIANVPATPAGVDRFGARFAVEFPMIGPGGPVPVVTAWIILTGQQAPRLVSCYVKAR